MHINYYNYCQVIYLKYQHYYYNRDKHMNKYIDFKSISVPI